MAGALKPCPCGSGKSARVCCLKPVSRAARARANVVYDTFRSMLGHIHQQAEAHFGLQRLESWSRQSRLEVRPDDQSINLDFLTFNLPLETHSSLGQWALIEGDLPVDEAALLKAVLEEPFSIFRVFGRAGDALEVVDVFRRELRTLSPGHGLEGLPTGFHISARIVDHEGLTLPLCLSSGGLEEKDAAYAVDGYRKGRSSVRKSTLLKPREATRMFTLWAQARTLAQREVDDMLAFEGGLMNFDGEPMVWVTETFTFDARREAWLRQALARVAGLREDEMGCYAYCPTDSTVEGSILLGPGRLTVQGNSVARSQRLLETVREVCGDLLVHEGSEHQDVSSLVTSNLVDEWWADDEEQEPQEAFTRYHEQTISWVVKAYLDSRASQVSRSTLWRERVFLEMLELALDTEGPRAFAVELGEGEKFSSARSSFYLAAGLGLVLSYAREMVEGDTDSKHWKTMISVLKNFYRWLGRQEVLDPAEARKARALLDGPWTVAVPT